MIQGYQAATRPRKTLLVLQGVGLIFLTVLLIELFSGGKGQLLIQGIMAGLGAIFFVVWPHWGIMLLPLMWMSEISPRLLGIGALSIPRLLTALLLVPCALTVLRDRTIWVLRVPQLKIYLAIGVLLVVSTWWSDFKYPFEFFPEIDQTARNLEIFFTRLLFLILFLYFIKTRQTIEISIWLVLGLIAYTAMDALMLTGAAGVRARAGFGLAANSNRLAFICLFATSLLWFYRSYGETRIIKTLTLPLLFFLPLTALATGSRSGFLQIVVLAVLIIKGQEGWSVQKRVRSFLFLGMVFFLLSAAVPAAQFMRATTFDPNVQAKGKGSLNKRIETTFALLEIAASNPVLGIGIGNFRWMHQTYFGEARASHNSYLKTLAEGGVGTLALYLALFYTTYAMLKKLERAGPRELLWLSKGLKVNLILFLVFSAFADFWLSDFLYLTIGLTVAMTCLWQRQELRLAKMRARPRTVPTALAVSN